MLGKTVYLLGGGQATSSDAIVRISADGTATHVGSLGEPLSDLGAAVIGKTAYIAGGYTGAIYATGILAFRGGTPKLVARLPVGLRYAGVAALDGRVYVAGGVTTSGTSDAVYVFDPKTKSVSKIATLPTAVAHAPLVALGGSLYLIGGAGSNTVYRIRPGGGVTVAGRLPTTLANAAAVALGSSIYVLGGDGSNAVLRLTPADSASTASASRGHASFAQSPKSRSVRHASAIPTSGSTQRNVPLRPKWPNVRGELRAPVQCGRLAVAELEAEAPVVRLLPAEARQHAVEAGELHGRRLVERLAARSASARAARARPRAAARASASTPEAARAGEREAPHVLEVRGERHLGALADERAEHGRSRCSSRCAACPAARSACSPSNGRPEACASRCRTVEPGGPAGSSRSTIPSSTATSTATAVASFVTDAHG